MHQLTSLRNLYEKSTEAMAAQILRRFLMPSAWRPMPISASRNTLTVATAAAKPSIRTLTNTPTLRATYNQVAKVNPSLSISPPRPPEPCH